MGRFVLDAWPPDCVHLRVAAMGHHNSGQQRQRAADHVSLQEQLYEELKRTLAGAREEELRKVPKIALCAAQHELAKALQVSEPCLDESLFRRLLHASSWAAYPSAVAPG